MDESPRIFELYSAGTPRERTAATNVPDALAKLGIPPEDIHVDKMYGHSVSFTYDTLTYVLRDLGYGIPIGQ